MEVFDRMTNKIIEVEWFDAQSGFSIPIEIEEVKDIKPFHTFSVGYLLREDKESIVLGFMITNHEDGPKSFKHWQLIPKGMIKNIKVLRK